MGHRGAQGRDLTQRLGNLPGKTSHTHLRSQHKVLRPVPGQTSYRHSLSIQLLLLLLLPKAAHIQTSGPLMTHRETPQYSNLLVWSRRHLKPILTRRILPLLGSACPTLIRVATSWMRSRTHKHDMSPSWNSNGNYTHIVLLYQPCVLTSQSLPGTTKHALCGEDMASYKTDLGHGSSLYERSAVPCASVVRTDPRSPQWSWYCRISLTSAGALLDLGVLWDELLAWRLPRDLRIAHYLVLYLRSLVSNVILVNLEC